MVYYSLNTSLGKKTETTQSLPSSVWKVEDGILGPY